MNVQEKHHPEPAVLERFLRGEATLAEKGAIVRHLLAGCGECAAATRMVWELADRPLLPLKTPGGMRP